MRALVCEMGPGAARLVRRLVRPALTGSGITAVTAGRSPRRTAAMVRDLRPDLLVAVGVAGGSASDGVGLARKVLLEAVPRQPRILIVGEADDPQGVADALRAGVLGWVPFSATATELSTAAMAVARGYTVLGPALSRDVLLAAGQHRPAAASSLTPLTNREKDVFALMAAGHTTRRVAQILVLGENTVRSHLQRIYRKLDLSNQVELVIFAYEAGFAPAAGAGLAPACAGPGSFAAG